MSYVPPHKRQSKDSSMAPCPIPSSLVVKHKHFFPFQCLPIQDSVIVKRKHSIPYQYRLVMYGDDSIKIWFAVGTIDHDGQFPSSVHLKPSCMKQPHLIEEETFVLVNDDLNADNIAMRPWVLIAERVQPQLLSSFQHLKKQNLDLKPTLVARFGKIHFRNVKLGTFDKSCLNETGLSKFKRVFYTNLPGYMDNINVGGLASKMGLASLQKKEMYLIKISDSTRPTPTLLSCRCRLRDNKLELHKIELNQVRHMIADISCLSKNLDLRVMLCTKTMLSSSLTDEEMNEISSLVNSAILDPDVMGGLKWPQGEDASPGNRFRVAGIWHTISTTYTNSSVKLKVRDADRYDFRTSIAEATTEIHLKLNGIVSELQRGDELDLVSDRLTESLKMIWDNLLSFT